MSFSQTEKKVGIQVVTCEDIDLAGDYTISDLLAVAKEHGLVGSPEVGVMAAIDYKDQPAHECIMVAMEPAPDSNGNLWIFSIVVSSLGPMLWTHHCPPNQKWPKSTRWLFAYQE